MKKDKKTILKQTGNSQTGKPLDRIDTNPQLKNSDGRSQQEGAVASTPSIEEGKALTIPQRQKRSRIFKRNLPKLERARELAMHRVAGPEKLKIRAEKAARELLKKRLAGRRGVSYELLSDPEKISVDKKLEKKQALIKRLAARLLPRIRRAEFDRFKSFTQGTKMKDLSTAAVVSMESMSEEELVYSINEMLETLEKDGDPIANSLKDIMHKISPLDEIKEALMKRAVNNGIPFEILETVYERGLEAWNESNTSQSQHQYAFSRVNSYISHGKAYDEDVDLREDTTKDFVMIKMRTPSGKTVWRKYRKSLEVDKEFEKEKEKEEEKEKKDNKIDEAFVREFHSSSIIMAAKKQVETKKQQDKVAYDKIMDSARTREAAAKNRETRREEKEVWDQPNPKKKSKKLTPAKKAKAKARAKAAGRPYPNLIDNMAVAREQVETETKSLNENFSFLMDKTSGVGKMVTADQAGIGIKSSFSLLDGMEEYNTLSHYESLIRDKLNYIVFEAVDEEGKMAKGELNAIVKKARTLLSKMGDKKQLDAWIQSKITKSADYINSVHDYLTNNKQDVDK